MKRNASFLFPDFSIAAGRTSGFFFALILALGSALGCQVAPPLQNPSLSSIDSQFRLSKTKIKPDEIDGSIVFYRSIVSKTLASHCKWYPSDSTYTSIAQKRCGLARGTLHGISRFMTEEDAAQMGYPIVLNHNAINFVDLPDDCSL